MVNNRNNGKRRVKNRKRIGLTQQASVRRGPRASATSLLTVALADAASTCSPRAPCLGYLASHGCARRRSKHLFAEGPVPRLPSFSRLRSQTQQASVRRGPPCLGYLASHGCARTDAASICSPRGPVPRLPSFSRLRSQTQQASVRRGPRASAT